jgi:hypothetical protein
MKAISYTRLQKSYLGEYIGRKNTRILAHAKTYTLLIKKLTQMHIDRKHLVIGFVPPKSTTCIYAF